MKTERFRLTSVSGRRLARRIGLVNVAGIEAVTGTNGRGSTTALRPEPTRLPQDDATRHRAIIDALPAHVAMLDTSGLIVSVNESWRRFAEDNGGESSRCGIGVNYLAVCDQAGGDDDGSGSRTAEGLRAVLRGHAKSFSIQYPCHSPTAQRWFELAATPLDDGDFSGAIVMHVDITARNRSAEALRGSETEQRQLAEALEVERARLVAAQRVAKVGSWETDLTTLSAVWSAETHRIYGTLPQTFLPTHAGFLGCIHPDDREMVEAAFDKSLGQRDACSIAHRVLLASGEIKFVEERWQVFFDANGRPVRAVGTCQDITERREADDRIRRLNRVYAVLSGVNTLIVRVREREALFREACRIATEAGGFRMAMISIRDRETMKLVPTAMAGKDEVLMSAIRARLSSSEMSATTMVARVMREKRAVISNDSRNDPQVVFARQYDESGVRSMAVLPLLVADEAVGVLALYSAELDFFHTDEMKLLLDLADNVAFAVDHLDKRERLDYLAYYDVLTGLANRTLFLNRVGQFMRSTISSEHKVAVCMIDLERFKDINDTLGRAAGDTLLRQVADQLRDAIGDGTLVARVGADHFAVVLPDVRQPEDAARLIETSMQRLHAHQFRLNEGVYRVVAKVGIALFPNDGIDADTLYNRAEAALKKAKNSGDRYLFYTQTLSLAVANRLTHENQLRQALDRQEFVLHYQPKVSLATGELMGAEALIRWNDPRTGLVPPGKFISILEETGLIHDVGRWALQKAVDDYLSWRSQGLAAVRIAVNVSSLQLRSPGFVTQMQQIIDSDPAAASGLELEITESMLMGDMAQCASVLRAIRAMGVTIAIDDFGTGFSSLGYLSKLPVDSLKIDRSFVTEMTSSQEGFALVSTIVTLAHSLKLKVVAEGVETEEQARHLRLLYCDQMQGFLFSRPVPAEVFQTRLQPAGDAVPAAASRLRRVPSLVNGA